MSIFRRSRASDQDAAARGNTGSASTAAALLREVLSVFDKEFPPRRPQVIDQLTFRDVVTYFTDKHPGDPRIRAGALLASEHPKGRMMFQVFLDDADQLCLGGGGVPYGRRMVVKRLDDELAARFGQHDLLIFR